MQFGCRSLALRLPTKHGAAARFVVYSTAIHLTLALFGRPLGLSLSSDSKPATPFRVHLVETATSTTVDTRRPGGDGIHPPSAADRTGTAVFPPEPAAAQSDTLRTGPIEEAGGVQVVDAVGPTLPQPEARPKRPKNMHGPEDCLLKLVSMICPAADLQCMADYRAFCASLPTSETAPEK